MSNQKSVGHDLNSNLSPLFITFPNHIGFLYLPWLFSLCLCISLRDHLAQSSLVEIKEITDFTCIMHEALVVRKMEDWEAGIKTLKKKMCSLLFSVFI